MHVIAGKAVCFGEALQPEFKAYAQAIIANAKALAETLLAGGLKLVSGGTDNHLMLVDVTPLGIGGKLATQVLEHCGITVNMNMIPFDTRKPMDPSGIRIGTPALTTRGMGVDEMQQIGRWMLDSAEDRRPTPPCSSAFAAKSAACASNFPFRQRRHVSKRCASDEMPADAGATDGRQKPHPDRRRQPAQPRAARGVSGRTSTARSSMPSTARTRSPRSSRSSPT